jgi:hypothetical protein
MACKHLDGARKWLRLIARKTELARERMKKEGYSFAQGFNRRQYDRWTREVVVTFRPRGMEFEILPRVDDEGWLQIDLPRYINTTVDAHIEATRIRQCPICKKIFWAGRDDKSACTGSCTNIFWVKQSPSYKKRYRHSKKEREDRRKKGR